MWVLRIDPGSYGRAINAFNSWAISPISPILCLFSINPEHSFSSAFPPSDNTSHPPWEHQSTQPSRICRGCIEYPWRLWYLVEVILEVIYLSGEIILNTLDRPHLICESLRGDHWFKSWSKIQAVGSESRDHNPSEITNMVARNKEPVSKETETCGVSCWEEGSVSMVAICKEMEPFVLWARN